MRDGGLGFLVLFRVPVLGVSGAGASALAELEEAPSKSPACRLSERDKAALATGTDSEDFLRAPAGHSWLLGSEACK